MGIDMSEKLQANADPDFKNEVKEALKKWQQVAKDSEADRLHLLNLIKGDGLKNNKDDDPFVTELNALLQDVETKLDGHKEDVETLKTMVQQNGNVNCDQEVKTFNRQYDELKAELKKWRQQVQQYSRVNPDPSTAQAYITNVTGLKKKVAALGMEVLRCQKIAESIA